ncbi:MAG: GNAT family N-acetyltransferase [Bacteroidota bacterium]
MPANASLGTRLPVTLRQITEESVLQVCQLSDTLPPLQQKMVAPNALSIAQAHYNKCLWPVAIYAGETPVGFMMLYDNPQEPKYFIWRLMVAAPFQKMGYGERAVQLLAEYVRTRPRAKELLVSCVEGEGSPEGFYEKLGFRRTGERLDEEVVLRLGLGP